MHIVLIGAPNSGKTTLYNWLTNSNFKTVNYPGATVEYSVGKLAERYFNEDIDSTMELTDTPGVYSLFPQSKDEVVTQKVLFNSLNRNSCKVILVVDGTKLNQQLNLAAQLSEAGFSFVIAVTMTDVMKKNQISTDFSAIEKFYKTKVVLIDGLLGGGISELVKVANHLPRTESVQELQPWSVERYEQQIQKNNQLLQAERNFEVIQNKLKGISDQTLKLDRYFLHPFFGVIIFFLIMWSLFSAIYLGATPLMDMVDQLFSFFAETVKAYFGEGLLSEFLSDGVITSFAAIFVFVPQIFILFFGIGLLEGSGYLARAATLIDRPFSKIGMSGRSFVPLLSGFACAVPALMATRNINSPRDRLITHFVIPLMSCSARLPVYALLLGFVFINKDSTHAAFALACLYFGSILVGAVAAGILNRILKRNETSFFMMELPRYQLPRFKMIFRQSFYRTWSYVKKAGPIIFIFAVVIWLSSTFPQYQLQGTERLESSYIAQVGKVIEPVFEPMGADWRVGVGLIAAFAAREVFVSSLAVMFNIAADDEAAQEQGLLAVMSEAKNSSGEFIFTVSTVVGLLIFFMIALQCMSTVAVQVKESGSLKFALLQLVIFNVSAYILAVICVQGLRFIGIA